MIFRRIPMKRAPRHSKARVESCVHTILELDKRLGKGKIKPEIIQQFERLKDSLQYVDDESVDGKDIDKIEQATNQLLAEIQLDYAEGITATLHEGDKH